MGNTQKVRASSSRKPPGPGSWGPCTVGTPPLRTPGREARRLPSAWQTRRHHPSTRSYTQRFLTNPGGGHKNECHLFWETSQSESPRGGGRQFWNPKEKLTTNIHHIEVLLAAPFVQRPEKRKKLPRIKSEILPSFAALGGDKAYGEGGATAAWAEAGEDEGVKRSVGVQGTADRPPDLGSF